MPAEMQYTVPSNRARQILRALVESFIRDGHPVGSRRLAKASGIDLSPATIRNVMADLEELGFIASPHTSAGRIPTARGYRVFVDTLVKLRPPASRDVAALQDQIVDDASADVKGLAAAASAALYVELLLSAQNCDGEPTSMRLGAVLPEVNALPGAKVT